MTTFKQAVQQSPQTTLTTNGMVTLEHSGNPLVDLFGSIGSARGKDMSLAFARAYAEDADLAMKVLFWARDARDGAGERETFRNLLKSLELSHPESIIKNLRFIPEVGRTDDLLIFTTPKVKLAAFGYYVHQLREGNALFGKWAPRKGQIANELRKYLNFTPKQYRRMIVDLSDTVEQDMCAKNWGEINYSHVPSVAASRYMKAFSKNDSVRYAEWKQGLATGETKVNSSVLYPYQVIKSVNHGDQDVALAQWESLPNYLGDNKILPMVDVSGSMTSQVGGQRGVGLTCLEVAVSLGLFCADKQVGAFKDCFLNFSSKPRIQVLTGNLLSKLAQMNRSEWEMSTNIKAAFDEILRVAAKHNVQQDEMPSALIIFSDMQFNYAVVGNKSVGAFDLAKAKFAEAGYVLPKVVFWQLNAKSNGFGNSPVEFHESGTALVSGFSPNLMKSILAGKSFTPYDIMMETIGVEKYKDIVA